VGKLAIFGQYILEMVYDRHGCYGTLTGNHRYLIDPCRLRWSWVT